MNIKALSDDQLEAAFGRVAENVEKQSLVAIGILAEIVARRLDLRAGEEGPFYYCVKKWKLSKHTAWRWSNAAKAIAADPTVWGRLRDGQLSVCVAAMLAAHPYLLAKADGMTKVEAEEALAGLKSPGKKRDILPPLLPTHKEESTLPFKETMTASAPLLREEDMPAPMSVNGTAKRKSHACGRQRGNSHQDPPCPRAHAGEKPGRDPRQGFGRDANHAGPNPAASTAHRPECKADLRQANGQKVDYQAVVAASQQDSPRGSRLESRSSWRPL